MSEHCDHHSCTRFATSFSFLFPRGLPRSPLLVRTKGLAPPPVPPPHPRGVPRFLGACTTLSSPPKHRGLPRSLLLPRHLLQGTFGACPGCPLPLHHDASPRGVPRIYIFLS